MEGEVSIKSKIKELFNHGLIYGLTSSLQSILGFLLLPILTVYYSPAEFGVYSIILLASALASAIFYFGASSALGRYYYDEDSDIYRRQIVSTALFITIIGAIVLIVLSILFGKKVSTLLFSSPNYYLHLVLAFSGTAFGFLLNTMTLLLRYEKRSKLFMIITLTGVVVNFIITYLLLTKYMLGILAPIYGILISNGISFSFLLFTRLKSITYKLDSKITKSFLNFGIQASISGILFYILDWVDRIIIKDLLDLSQVGIYSLGYRLGAIINIIVIVPFSLIWSPMRMQYSKNSNADRFTTKIISYYTLIGVAIIIVSILFSQELLSLFFSNKEYQSAAKVYPIIMFSILIYGYQGIVDYGIYFHKKVYLYILASVIAIFINIILNYTFIPKFGYIAAAYITLITYAFTTSFLYFFSNKLYPIKIEWKRLFSLFLILVMLYNIISYIQLLLIVKILLMILLLVVLYYKFLDLEEKDFIRKRLKNNFKFHLNDKKRVN
jgi:O-antigen/teichoic acid export membrane protein